MNPAMLFIDTKVSDVILIIITSLMGMFAVGAGIEGFLSRELKAWERLLAIGAGLLMLYPGLVTNLIGIALFVVVYFLQKQKKPAAA